MKFSLKNYIEQNSDLSKKEMYEILKANGVVTYSYNNFLKKFNADNLSAKELLILNTNFDFDLTAVTKALKDMAVSPAKVEEDTKPVKTNILPRMFEYLKENKLILATDKIEDFNYEAKFYKHSTSPTNASRIFLLIYNDKKGFLFETEQDFVYGKLRWEIKDSEKFKNGLSQAVEEYRTLIDLELKTNLQDDPEFYFPEADKELEKQFKELLPETFNGYHRADLHLDFGSARKNLFFHGLLMDGYTEPFYYIKLDEDGTKNIYGLMLYGEDEFGSGKDYVFVQRDDVFFVDGSFEKVTHENLNDYPLGYNYDEKGLIELERYKMSEYSPEELFEEFKKLLV